VTACLLDDSSLLALGQGYPALPGFIVDAAAGRAHLTVPALCLCAAEAQRPGIAKHIGMLPVDVEPPESATASSSRSPMPSRPPCQAPLTRTAESFTRLTPPATTEPASTPSTPA
jgi:hypothetical protein